MSEENKSPLSREERKAQRQAKLAAKTPEERAKLEVKRAKKKEAKKVIKRAKKKETKKAERSGQTPGDQTVS